MRDSSTREEEGSSFDFGRVSATSSVSDRPTDRLNEWEEGGFQFRSPLPPSFLAAFWTTLGARKKARVVMRTCILEECVVFTKVTRALRSWSARRMRRPFQVRSRSPPFAPRARSEKCHLRDLLKVKKCEMTGKRERREAVDSSGASTSIPSREIVLPEARWTDESAGGVAL